MIHANAGLLLLKPFFPKTRFIIRESSLPVALIREYGWKGKICKLVYKILYPMADLVISPATAITKEFENDIKINTRNHQTLYNPVNENRLQSTVTKLDFDQRREITQRFICVGRLGFEKGYDRLIEALANYTPANNYDWKVEIVGKGAEIKNLGELIRKHDYAEKIKLVGYQNTPWPYMAASDCLLLPSRWEGMPNVVLEALASGIPVIAHKDAGGVSEIAELANDGDVKVAQNMNEFVEFMKEIRPAAPTLPIKSKLPEEFRLGNVMEKFKAML